jgi:hypothetical protein
MFTRNQGNQPTVLSVYPCHRGFAFVLFEAPLSPHDWGLKEIKQDVTGANTAVAVKELVERYRPDVLVLDDPGDHRGSARRLKLLRINKALARFVGTLGTGVAIVSRRKVRSAFAQFGATNKHDIALAIGKHLDAFATRLPRKRVVWAAEDRRMGIFDAASRALAYYYQLQMEGDED